ncbi:MAG: hypothetical protein EZS28_022831 [Streblomastix strix]|uniref:Uncharacterized protein n=1 Tax=Streblomastix strix TaxID=222440 RepID=A0A5J4VH02_9EUKA|nr:MAG: hypothetical protein EZS28_022831 [Streblomastix strix]
MDATVKDACTELQNRIILQIIAQNLSNSEKNGEKGDDKFGKSDKQKTQVGQSLIIRRGTKQNTPRLIQAVELLLIDRSDVNDQFSQLRIPSPQTLTPAPPPNTKQKQEQPPNPKPKVQFMKPPQITTNTISQSSSQVPPLPPETSPVSSPPSISLSQYDNGPILEDQFLDYDQVRKTPIRLSYFAIPKQNVNPPVLAQLSLTAQIPLNSQQQQSSKGSSNSLLKAGLTADQQKQQQKFKESALVIDETMPIKQLQQQIAQLESKSTTSPGYIVDLWAEFTPIDQIRFQQQKDMQQKLVPCFFVRPGTVDGGIATSPLSLSLPHNSFFIRVRSNDTSQSLGTRILRMIGGWLRFSSLIRTFIHMRFKSGNELLPLSCFGEDSDQFYNSCHSLLIEMAEREAQYLPNNITNPSPSLLTESTDTLTGKKKQRQLRNKLRLVDNQFLLLLK